MTLPATIDHAARAHSSPRPLRLTLKGDVDPGLRSAKTLPVSYLLTLFEYDPETGKLFWRVASPRAAIGSEAGHDTKGGRYVQIDGSKYRVSRVVWAMHHGAWPTAFIDHADLDMRNNRPGNLRLASRSHNNMNRPARATSLVKGVSYRSDSGRWRARITVDGVIHHLGSYKTMDEAHAAYTRAAPTIHGQYARTE